MKIYTSRLIQKYLYAVVIAIAVSCGISCVQVHSGNVREQPVTQIENPQENFGKDQEVKVVHSKMINEADVVWKTSILNSRFREQNQHYFFLNKEIGWVFGENLYKTVDGGKTWAFMKFAKDQEAIISQIVFIDKNTGWAITQVSADYSRFEKNSFELLATYDGGVSWSRQSNLEGVVINDFNFVTENIGWVAGIKYTGVSPVQFEIYMLVTHDGGKNWRDVSKSLNRTLAENQKELNQSVSAINYYAGQIFTISSNNKLFQTNDFGSSWSYIDSLPNDNFLPFMRINRIAMSQDKTFWLAGGGYHYGSALGFITKKVDTGWELNELENIYFAEAGFISDNEVVACGLEIQNDRKPLGVILHSSDGGRTWKTILRNEKVDNIQNLQIIDQDVIICWDNHGTVYKLNRY